MSQAQDSSRTLVLLTDLFMLMSQAQDSNYTFVNSNLESQANFPVQKNPSPIVIVENNQLVNQQFGLLKERKIVYLTTQENTASQALQNLEHEVKHKQQLEAKLFTRESKMRAALEAMSELVIIHRVEENELEIMPTSWSASYPKATAIINQTLEQILKISQSKVSSNPVKKVLDTKQPCSFEYNLSVEDTQLWFLARISLLSNNSVVWVVRDITERKHLEQALFQEKELAQITLQSIGDAVITTDAMGKVLEMNTAAEQMTGWQKEQARGLPLLDIFKIVNETTRQPVENPIYRALHEDRVVELANNTILIARDSTEYYIADSAAPIRDRRGKQIGAVMVFRDVTESRQLALQLSWQASHDALTKLYNRREFEKKIVEAINNSKNKNSQYVLCYLDLDQFKVVNDTCGHAAGDELLRQVSALLQQQVRSTDAIGRLGGDEFGILLSRCSLETAEQLAEKLRKSIHDIRFCWQGKTFTIGVSIGLIALNAETQDLTKILSAADAACFAAKHRGRNCVHVYRADDQELARQQGELQWLSNLNQALVENRFRLYSQKIIPLNMDDSSEHHEVLLRLVDEQGKLILPMAFIPAAERYSLMPKIDRWVIETFIRRYQTDQNLKPKSCDQWYSLNISGASLNNEQFVSFLQEQLTQCSFPQKICFEITETTAISNLTKAVKFMGDLIKLGCCFALDDFGSGMSSLAYLKNLPVSYLKIDGSFVKNMVKDPIDRGMVESCNRMAHLMGIKTIAEFVEDEATLEQLRNLGVDYAQGHTIGKPYPLNFKA